MVFPYSMQTVTTGFIQIHWRLGGGRRGSFSALGMDGMHPGTCRTRTGGNKLVIWGEHWSKMSKIKPDTFLYLAFKLLRSAEQQLKYPLLNPHYNCTTTIFNCTAACWTKNMCGGKLFFKDCWQSSNKCEESTASWIPLSLTNGLVLLSLSQYCWPA